MKPNKISSTAAFIAIKFFGLAQYKKFRRLFEPSVVAFYDQLIKNFPAPLRFYHFWLQFEWIRKIYIALEEMLLPGDLLHIVARKYMIHSKVANLIDEGYEQIIILGAGFDHLGYYFSEKGIYCLECDVPRMATQKKRLLNEIYPNRKGPEIVPWFFPKNRLDELLKKNSRLKSDKRTIVVAEGLFDYLERDSAEEILEQLKSCLDNKPAILTTHFALDEIPPFYRSVYTLSVKMVGESLKLKYSLSEFRTLFRDKGFKVYETIERDEMENDLKSHTGTSLSILKGFYLLYIH